MRIEGTVAPGFESVKRLYEHNMRTLAEENTQLCVYHEGKKVVDLWASADSESNFSADILVNVFSSGKNLEAIAMASLVDKGLLRYDAKVIDYWPEFGANGKQQLTVAEVMRHEAGLAGFDTSMAADALLTKNIKQNSIGSIIESQSQKFRKTAGGTREYHAITRGWIVNEIFRRIDPQGRTIGEFLREDISGPLGVDAIVGVREEELGSIASVSPLGFRFQFLQSLKPKLLNRKIEQNIFQTLAKVIQLLPRLRDRTTRGAPPALEGMEGIGIFNNPAIRRGEIPSANTHATARSLAKIAAMMAAGGSWAGTEYLSKNAWQALHGALVEADMGFITTRFSQGGLAFFDAPKAGSNQRDRALNLGREGFYGWMGLGGSIFQWHPENNIGFGYVPTSLHILDLVNERGKAYQAEVLSCVASIRKQAA